MRKLTDGFIGVLVRSDYRLEVWKTKAPKKNRVIQSGHYFYLTKINFDGEVGKRSIGLPASDLSELIEILRKMNGTSQNSNQNK
ncbi:hypothetical protein [Nitrosomonas sp.]|uniref:hypothetical protein n=1 Tax=Nitrosomonas sp. TaxID=42353 RepID=UPI0020860EA3|nr:hypothetical protein [Nitrosomonas sp.]GJL74543.1 MAG: hypothetical protein NMNS02_06490 [Nitrosomonas sp.]